MNQEKTNISFPVDYHIHTILCNHAGSSMEAYIKKAVSMGFQEICFLDHLTLTEPGHEFSMTPEEVPLYFNAVQTLKKRYIGIINIKAGLEIDFNPFHVDLLKKISESYAFDVIGSSLHFPGGIDVVSRKSEWSRGEKDSDYIYGIYLESLDKMLDHSYFDIVCHLDLVKKFGGNPSRSFENEFNCIIEKISKKKLTVEVNTSGYIHSAKEAYPSFDIIKKCRKAGVEISIGSDAHDPESIGLHYDTVLPLILRAGYKQISVFTKRKRSGIPLPAGYGNN
ncbi:MAG: histidinol-phosphatase HisJ family protein [Proteobacteria bacterium]|nr:histidinol-phosphatase HisJ family protein [Pseudomonadota bacterium]